MLYFAYCYTIQVTVGIYFRHTCLTMTESNIEDEQIWKSRMDHFYDGSIYCNSRIFRTFPFKFNGGKAIQVATK